MSDEQQQGEGVGSSPTDNEQVEGVDPVTPADGEDDEATTDDQ